MQGWMSAAAEEYNVSELAIFGDDAYLETAKSKPHDSTKCRLIPIGHYPRPLRSEPGARQKSTGTWWPQSCRRCRDRQDYNARRLPRLSDDHLNEGRSDRHEKCVFY